MLIVTNSRVWSRGEGRNLRFTRLVSALVHAGLHIDLVTSRPALSPQDVEGLHRGGISHIVTGKAAEPSARRLRLRQALRSCMPEFLLRPLRATRLRMKGVRPSTTKRQSRPRKISELQTPLLATLVRDYVRQYQPHYVMVEYIMHGYALDFLKDKDLRERPVTIIDTYDVAYQRCDALANRGVPGPESVTREEEQQILSGFDIVVAIQDEDKAIFEAMVPGRTVVTCLPASAPAPAEPLSPCAAKSLLFVGGDYEPNAQGITEFLRHSWPAVRAKHPSVTLTVVGNICRRFEGADFPGVSFSGYEEDLRAAYAAARVVISPVTFGGGLKIKTIEALGYGRPVVATTHSSIGLSKANGHGLVVAADWNSFSAEINRLLSDSERTVALAQAALEYTARHFSEPAVMHDLLEAMAAHLPQHCGLTVAG